MCYVYNGVDVDSHVESLRQENDSFSSPDRRRSPHRTNDQKVKEDKNARYRNAIIKKKAHIFHTNSWKGNDGSFFLNLDLNHRWKSMKDVVAATDV